MKPGCRQITPERQRRLKSTWHLFSMKDRWRYFYCLIAQIIMNDCGTVVIAWCSGVLRWCTCPSQWCMVGEALNYILEVFTFRWVVFFRQKLKVTLTLHSPQFLMVVPSESLPVELFILFLNSFHFMCVWKNVVAIETGWSRSGLDLLCAVALDNNTFSKLNCDFLFPL